MTSNSLKAMGMSLNTISPTELINRIFGEGIEWDAQQKTPQNVVVESKCVGGWVNEMKSGEYNPVHYHPFCNLTSVFYFN